MEACSGTRLVCPNCSGRHVAGDCRGQLRRRLNRLLSGYRVRRYLR
jgi:hypothetical protein